MSNFLCHKCGVLCIDSTRGYINGCKHYPPDIKPQRGFGTLLNVKTGASRKWFIDDFGTKRWGDNEKPCNT